MADNVQMTGLEFQIVGKADDAIKSLRSLTSTLRRLKKETDTISNGSIGKLEQEFQSFNGLNINVDNIVELADAIKGIGKGSQTIATVRRNLAAISELDFTDSARSLGQITAEVFNFNDAFGDQVDTEQMSTMVQLLGAIAKHSRNIMTVRNNLQMISTLDFSNLQGASTAIQGMVDAAGTKMPAPKIAPPSSDYEQVDETVVAIDNVDEAASDMTDSVNESADALDRQGRAASESRGALGGLGERLRSVAGTLGSFGLRVVTAPFRAMSDQVRTFADNVRQTVQPVSQFVSSLGRILMYRAIRGILASITQGIGEGIKNLYNSNERFRGSMDTLATSALYLKNSLAGMLAPAINALAPVVDAIVDRFVDFINVINQLIAVVTGSSTWQKAIKVPAQFAEATNGAADSAGRANAAAKELQRTLMGYDEINKLNPDSGSGGSGGGGGGSGGSGDSGGIMFTTEAVNLSETLGDLFEPLKAAWENKGQDVIDAAKRAFESLKGAVSAVQQSLVTVWQDGTGQRYVESLLGKWESFLNVIDSIASTFTEAWTEGERGDAVITSLFNKATQVNTMISTIANTFANVWKNDTGTTTWSHILEIVTNVNNTIGNLANRFTTAWNNAGNGEGIVRGVLTIVNDLLDGVSSISASTAEWAANLNLSPLLSSVKDVVENLEPIVAKIKDALVWVWDDFVLPLATKLVESSLPTFLSGIASALEIINDWLGKIQSLVGPLLDSLNFEVNPLEAITSQIPGLSGAKTVFDIVFNTSLGPGSDATINTIKEQQGEKKTNYLLSLMKNGWDTLGTFVQSHTGVAVKKPVGVERDKTGGNNSWTVESIFKRFWMGAGVDKPVGVTRKTIDSKTNWTVGGLMSSHWMGGAVSKPVGVTRKSIDNKTNWTVASVITSNWMGGAISKSISITAANKLKPKDYISKGSISFQDGGGSSKTTLYAVPLARGGIVNAATLFGPYLVGEAGKEAIVPLEDNVGWIDKVASRVVSMMGGSGQQDITIHEHIYLDGRQIKDNVVQHLRSDAAQGNFPLYGVV